jgi:ABC-type uncharacterized transport system substrate-binding protein
MRRRDFIAGLAGTAAWPLTASAQQPTARVGLLSGASFDGPYAVPVATIRQGLQESGFVEGQNLTIESRAANGRYERLAYMAMELVRRQVGAIVVIGASTPELAVAASVAPVPFVFAVAADAAEVGVGSDRGPDAGATSATATRLELLLELRPRVSVIGYLDNSRLSAAFEANVRDITAAAAARGRDIAVFDAGSNAEIEKAFTYMALQRVRALIVSADAFLTTREELIISAAAESRIPTIYAARDAAVRGGLMSYSVVASDMYRLAGIYAGRILLGAPPAASPTMLPTRFEFVINSKTAEAQRFTVPRRLQIRADEIIG